MEFLEGLSPLPALAGRLQLAVLSTDVFLQQFHKRALSFNTEERHFKRNEDSTSTKFSTLCVTANNRAPCDVERV